MNGKLVLLVEDNPVDIRLITQCLSEGDKGHYVMVLGNGEEAVSFLRKTDKYKDESSPDIIFLDLKLPRLSGLEILKIIREDNKTKDIPVVIITNSDYKGDIDEAMRLGITRFITKPLRVQDFIASIKEVVDSI